MLVKGRVGALLVGGGNKLVTLFFDPFAKAQLILCTTEQLRLILGVLASLDGTLNVSWLSRWETRQSGSHWMITKLW